LLLLGGNKTYTYKWGYTQSISFPLLLHIQWGWFLLLIAQVLLLLYHLVLRKAQSA
jgi:hypothetical protein